MSYKKNFFNKELSSTLDVHGLGFEGPRLCKFIKKLISDDPSFHRLKLLPGIES